MTVLSPFVYWAQNENNLFLKVDLKDVKQPQVVLETRKLQFQSKGHGAQGFKDYEFLIDFHSEIDENENNVKITDHKVALTLTKIEKGWWPRLTSQPQKPVWLKVDFDRWQSEDDLMDEDVRDVREDYPDLYDRLQKEEIGYRKEDLKKIYLSLYNLFMFCGYLYIAVVLVVGYLRDGQNSFPHVYDAVGPLMCSLQLLQLLEILHPIFGYVKGGPFMPLMQMFGRNFMAILMLHYEPRFHKMPLVFVLFLTWCSIEVIRYPYYLSRIYKRENGFLTWMRYSAWIILYPLGYLTEGIILFRNLIYIDESHKWSVSLPNPLNFTFHFATFLRIYILFGMIPSVYVLMGHMFEARKRKLGSKKSRKIKKS